MLNFNVIIVTTDLSDYSLRALPYAVGLAERFDAKLKVVCVVEPPMLAPELAWVSVDGPATEADRVADLKAGLGNIVEDQVPDGVDVEAKVFTGNPVDVIVDYANEANADLIVACTHGRRGLSHALMGSTAEAIVRRSPCPVLTLKQPMPVAASKKGA
jgi:nucleotide-binding universal stress UspA family protein